MSSRFKEICLARYVKDLPACTHFYADILQCPDAGRFETPLGGGAKFVLGDGVILELIAPVPDGHGGGLADHLVLHLADEAEVQALTAKLEQAGIAPVPPHNGYWSGSAMAVNDPDGFQLVFVLPVQS